MTYNEKKSLYEKIMWETAKTVKRMINESEDSGEKLLSFSELAQKLKYYSKLAKVHDIEKYLFIQISDKDFDLPVSCMIGSIFGECYGLRCWRGGLESRGFFESSHLKNIKAVVLTEVEKIENSSIDELNNFFKTMKNKNLDIPVILISHDDKNIRDNKEFLEKIVKEKLKY